MFLFLSCLFINSKSFLINDFDPRNFMLIGSMSYSSSDYKSCVDSLVFLYNWAIIKYALDQPIICRASGARPLTSETNFSPVTAILNLIIWSHAKYWLVISRAKFCSRQFVLACGHTLAWESIPSFISMETVHLTYPRSATFCF